MFVRWDPAICDHRKTGSLKNTRILNCRIKKNYPKLNMTPKQVTDVRSNTSCKLQSIRSLTPRL